MFCVVTGGSGSGKSRFAEELIVRLYKKNDTKSVSESPGSLYYFATMVPCGRETKEKIARHRQLRAGKGFVTVECQTRLGNHVPREEGFCVLLECMSNLAANELYMEETADTYGTADTPEAAETLSTAAPLSALHIQEQSQEKRAARCVETVMEGIEKMLERCAHLVVVTNEVFSEAETVTEEMLRYKEVLGSINRLMAERADAVYEVTCGIPVQVKGPESCGGTVPFSLGKERALSGTGVLSSSEKERKEAEKGGKEGGSKGMKLIIGGAFQGKSAAAKEMFPGMDWCDGRTCGMEDIFTCGGIFHLEAYIRRRLKEPSDMEAEVFVNLLEERNPQAVLVSDEVGCGLVPVDAFDRKYRELTGRVCTCIAERADTVIRVVCGIPTVLKERTGRIEAHEN